uniref:Uncharacterized protein n=1 Tax=Ascaris lumbricoides TaxID=6252 RepID=A0A9J2PXX6_ASCLU
MKESKAIIRFFNMATQNDGRSNVQDEVGKRVIRAPFEGNGLAIGSRCRRQASDIAPFFFAVTEHFNKVYCFGFYFVSAVIFTLETPKCEENAPFEGNGLGIGSRCRRQASDIAPFFFAVTEHFNKVYCFGFYFVCAVIFTLEMPKCEEKQAGAYSHRARHTSLLKVRIILELFLFNKGRHLPP